MPPARPLALPDSGRSLPMNGRMIATLLRSMKASMYMTAATGITNIQRRAGTGAFDRFTLGCLSGSVRGAVLRADAFDVGGEVDGGTHRRRHGPVRGHAGTGDVEGGAVVDGGPQDRQAR